jgi:quercetin dioxygenase-like cupin family protein
MTKPSWLLLLGCGIFASVAVAQNDAPSPVLAEGLRWMSPPNLSGVQASWVLGADQKPGTYVLRVKLATGAKIPPHFHPDERVSTVLAGTIYVGFSETFDEGKVVAIPTGAIYVAPANVAHFVWARDGDAMYQETGIGPTATSLVKR